MADTVVSGSTPRRKFSVDSLFIDHRPQAAGVNDLPDAKEIRLDRIAPDPDQPRRSFDEEKLAELVDSITSQGVLQPIVVRYDGASDLYIIIHGERRFRASQAAGLASMPALIRDVPPDQRLLQQLMENIVREDLNAVDRAAALQRLKASLGNPPWDDIATAVGIKRSRLFQLLGTARLPESIQQDIRDGRLSEKQTRPLQGMTEIQQLALRHFMIEYQLTAVEVTRLAKMLRASAIAEDAETANALLQEKLSRIRTIDNTEHALSQLTRSLKAASTGGRREQKALLQQAKSLGARPYSPERLQKEALALMLTLARMPLSECGDNHQVRQTIAALHLATGALLGKES